MTPGQHRQYPFECCKMRLHLAKEVFILERQSLVFRSLQNQFPNFGRQIVPANVERVAPTLQQNFQLAHEE